MLHINLYALPIKEGQDPTSKVQTLVSWHTIEEEMRPANFIKRVFVTKTIAESASFYYEFATPEEKAAYLDAIPEQYKKFIKKVTQKDLDEWVN